MNIKTVHSQDKPVSAVSLFSGENGNVTVIQILAGEKLKEHSTQIPALLICIEGKAIFGNAEGVKTTLLTGDFVHIEPKIIHWVEGVEQSQLVLIK